MSSDTEPSSEQSSRREARWICTGCGKVISSDPYGRCTDCGGAWKRPTPEDLACDRCGDPDASPVLNSEHDRLCEDCVDEENSDNPQCPECDRRMLPDYNAKWWCPGCMHMEGS